MAVAYSGGRDSTALLHATVQAARALGLQVHALHVHHGLSAQADAWLAHGDAQCRRWARRGLPVQFHARRVSLQPRAGESVEALARSARYVALTSMAHAAGCDLVLLAHHRRDQAETWLLQALRGAGPAGLAAMPRTAQRDGIVWGRPWVDRPRQAVEAYVKRHRLAFIDDDSNADARFARNRLRLGVWPALVDAFPQAEASLAAATRWAQQAQAVLDEVAAGDLAACRVALGDAGEGLDRACWSRLSAGRRAQVLRRWLRACTGALPDASLLERVQAEWPTARSGACWPVTAGRLRSYRGVLRHEPTFLPVQAVGSLAEVSQPTSGRRVPTSIVVAAPGRYEVPAWQGALVIDAVGEGGLGLSWPTTLHLRERSGGERFQAGPGRPARSLKKQFQMAARPAWSRDGPLVYGGDRLLFVPGLGLDARVLAAPGAPQFALRWEPWTPG